MIDYNSATNVTDRASCQGTGCQATGATHRLHSKSHTSAHRHPSVSQNIRTRTHALSYRFRSFPGPAPCQLNLIPSRQPPYQSVVTYRQICLKVGRLQLLTLSQEAMAQGNVQVVVTVPPGTPTDSFRTQHCRSGFQ